MTIRQLDRSDLSLRVSVKDILSEFNGLSLLERADVAQIIRDTYGYPLKMSIDEVLEQHKRRLMGLIN
jgi:hypothetical protein